MRLITRISIVVFAFALIGFSTPAEAADGLNVGSVNIQQALASSTAGKAAQKEYEKSVKKAQADLDRKKTDFEKRRQAFAKQRESLNGEARMKKEEELIKLEKELKRSLRDTEEELRRKNAQLVRGLVQELRVVVNEVGKEKGFTLLLETGSQAVLFVDKSIDVTEEVVKRFDQRMAKK